MKLLYLCTWDFVNEQSDGVCRKIKAQMKAFASYGLQVDQVYIREHEIIYRENGQERMLAHVGNIKKTSAYIKMYRYLKDKRYDWVYNRYGLMDTFYYRVLKRLHHNGARILVEIPTYPYIGEKPKGFLYQLMYGWDKIYLSRLKKVVERPVTYSRDDEIWGMPVVRIMNGIDLSRITPVNGMKKSGGIDLIAVALMQPYHGYERLLMGLSQYYANGGMRKITLHLVGDGPEKALYESAAAEKHLEEHVIFYGKKSGAELDEIYDKCDMGVCSLGSYKKGLYWTSELKSREYLAKGLPVISGVDIDIFHIIDRKYCLEFPNDASPVDVERIVEFYDEIYQPGRECVVRAIRSLAEQWVSMEAAMKPVYEYMAVEDADV